MGSLGFCRASLRLSIRYIDLLQGSYDCGIYS